MRFCLTKSTITFYRVLKNYFNFNFNFAFGVIYSITDRAKSLSSVFRDQLHRPIGKLKKFVIG